jgi:hypothetical protein
MKNGEWFMPIAVLIGFIGGEVKREEGRVVASLYGRTAEFTEGSAVAKANGADFDLGAEVFRGNKGQLYMPVDATCRIFGMKWAYAARNNFITVEHVSEDHPVPVQP